MHLPFAVVICEVIVVLCNAGVWPELFIVALIKSCALLVLRNWAVNIHLIVVKELCIGYFWWVLFFLNQHWWVSVTYKKIPKEHFFNWSKVDTQSHLNYNIVIPQVYTLCSAHYKSSYPLAPYKANTTTLFPMLGFLFPWLAHSITGSLCIPLPFTHLAQPPTPLPSGNHQLILCTYGSISTFLFVCSFVLCFNSTRSEIIWYWSFTIWLKSFSIIPSRSIHVVPNSKISCFFMAE